MANFAIGCGHPCDSQSQTCPHYSSPNHPFCAPRNPREITGLLGNRPRPYRERLAGSLHSHHRSRPEASGRAPRTRPRSRPQPARSLPPADPRRPRLCHQGPGETSVLFELISARYERRAMLITANQPFGEWGKVFPEPNITGCRHSGRGGISFNRHGSAPRPCGSASSAFVIPFGPRSRLRRRTAA